jgi:hypothetical protein
MRSHYWQWLEDRLLARYRDENPEDYNALQSMILSVIERTASNADIGDEDA